VNIRKSLPAVLATALIIGSAFYFRTDLAEWWNRNEVVQISFHFRGPTIYGNNEPYTGGDIYINGYIPGLMSWSVICDPSMDTNPSPTDMECRVHLPKGSTLIAQVNMSVAGAPGGMIHYGDMSSYSYSGNGTTLGSLNAYVRGEPVTFTLVQAPSWRRPNPKTPGDKGLQTYNFQINL
jgi:hypothetical protein